MNIAFIVEEQAAGLRHKKRKHFLSFNLLHKGIGNNYAKANQYGFKKDMRKALRVKESVNRYFAYHVFDFYK